MNANRPAPEDHVDRLRAQWATELPDVDTWPMAVLGRVNRLAHLVHPTIAATFARHDLDRGEFDVLATLRRSGGPYRLTPTELYKSLLISSGGLTHRLAKLERAGLVVREPSREDGRSLAVRLTRAGVARVEQAFRADMKNEMALLNSLQPDERKTLARLLAKLLAGVEQRSRPEAL